MTNNWQIKLGILLILLSGIAFAIMLFIPFLNIESRYKVIGSSIAFVVMEVFFWVGGLLVGKELFTKYKSYINPVNWFRRKGESK